MEDRIIGPLTMKQFVYLLVGGMVFYATIKAGNIGLIVFLGIPVAILALCLAFIKIQDQPFSKFLFSLILFWVKPRQRIWFKDWQIGKQIRPVIKKKKEDPKGKHIQKEVEKSELEKLSVILDTRGQEVVQKTQHAQGAPILKKKK